VHTYLLAGTFFALAFTALFTALLSLVVHRWGSRSTEFLLFSVLSLFAAGYSAGIGVAQLFGDGLNPRGWAMGIGWARVSAVMLVAAGLHFSWNYARTRMKLGAIIGLYGCAALCAVPMWYGSVASASRIHLLRVSVLGMDIYRAWAPAPAGAWVLFALAPLGLLFSCGLYASSYVKGRREALVPFAGAGLFMLSVINDALVGSGLLRGVHLAPVGFFVFALSLGILFVFRYAQAQTDLDRSLRDLGDRARELSATRLVLRDVQTELGRKEHLAFIGEMAAVIAHEVRNPLAVISNAVSSLRRDGLCRRDHEVLLGILDEEALRLNRIVSDLLRYARPVSVQRQRVVLHDLVQRATLLVGGRGEVSFAYDDAGARGQIWADGDLLRHVFDNIVENAVQAMGGAGTVIISIKPLSRNGVEGFAVSVTDEGEGMDTQVRSRAKDPFFTTRPAGTGLGLAIVDRIVDAHGGHLQIDSRSGEGTTVTVFLPLGRESIPPPSPQTALTKPMPGCGALPLNESQT
jgi:signal transduction histidine kinase